MAYIFKVFFITTPRLASKLSDGNLFRMIFTLFSLWYFQVSRKLIKYTKDYKFKFIYHKKTFTIYLRYPMDVAVLREVFVDKEYSWFPIEKPKYIIDLGAHFGDTALYYHAHFPQAKIIAVEPSPENFKRLQKNTKDISQIIIVQAAVGEVTGFTDLHIDKSSLGVSVQKRSGNETIIKVPQITLTDLLKEFSIQKADVIKFDIEGAEFSLFNNIQTEEISKTFIGEIHLDLTNIELQTFKNNFSKFDTTLIKIKDHRFMMRAKLKE